MSFEAIFPTDISSNRQDASCILNRLPVACCAFNADAALIAHNPHLIKLFALDNATPLEFIQIADFMPPKQPCGTPSMQLLSQYISDAISNGTAAFIMQFTTAIGTKINLNVNLSRESDFVIAVATPAVSHGFEMQLLLDTAPLAVSIFDINYKPIECNEQVLRTYGMSTKAEYFASFPNETDRTQPDGTESTTYLRRMIQQAFDEGYARAEFTARKADGSLLTVECTLVRMYFNGETVAVIFTQDVTEDRTFQLKKAEDEQTAILIADGSPYLIQFYDEDGIVTYCNKRVMNLFGVGSKELVGLWHSKFAPALQSCGTASNIKGRAFINRAFIEGHVRFEWTYQTADGEQLPVEVSLVRIAHAGKPMVIAYSTDLRAIKKAMARYQEASRLAESYFDSSPLFIEVWDDKHNLIDCNQQFLDVFGLTSKDEFHRRYNDFIPKFQPCGRASAEIIAEQIEITLQTGSSRIEFTHVLPSGELLPAETICMRVQQGDGYLVVANNHDLRAVRKAAEDAHEANKRAQLMLDTMPLSCFMIKDNRQEDGSVFNLEAIDCNRAAVSMFGFSNKADALKGFWDLFPESTGGDDGIAELAGVVAAAMEIGTMRFEYSMQTIKGEPVPCELTLVRLIYKGEPALACYVFDLREIKAMVEEMKRIDIAEEESRAKTRFLARMSHEIRTPLNAIIGITEIELQKAIHSKETEMSLYRIYSSSDMLRVIINDILDLSKVEAGKMEINNARYEFASLVMDTVQLNLMYLSSKPIKFQLYVDENLPTHFIGDELRVKQILNNLLSNAFKYTKEGEVSLSVNIQEPTRDTDVAQIVFKVEDTGQGMTKEQLDKLFDLEFIRFNTLDNRSIQGTGLGMSITYQLVELMNGRIFAESTPDVGTSFTVVMPQRIDSNAVIGSDWAQSLGQFEATQLAYRRRFLTPRTPLPFGRVLVVDDVESNVHVAKGLLMPYKLHIETAESGFEAIEKVKSGGTYDIIFMDHMMPELDGIETTKTLRSMGYTHPIVALTANTLKGQEELFMNSGFSGFVSKPINANQLDAYLMRFVRDRQSQMIDCDGFVDLPVSADGTMPATNNFGFKHLSKGLVDSFMRDVHKALDFLEDFEANHLDNPGEMRLKLYINHVHGMKSALANVGLDEFSAFARILEDVGRSEDLAIIKSETPLFVAGLRKIAQSFAADAPEHSDDAVYDFDYLKERLLALGQACEGYNKKGCKAVIDDITAKPCPKHIMEVLDTISVLLLESDFEEAAHVAVEAAKAIASPQAEE